MAAPAQGKRRASGGNRTFIPACFDRRMRAAVLLLLAGLAGCAGWEAPAGALAGADLASVTVFGRGLLDIGVSAVSGRDCSIVRLDRGQTYCAARFPAERAQPFCTRTLGSVTCWDDPALLPAPQTEVADTPRPTADQLRYRAARWPKSLFF